MKNQKMNTSQLKDCLKFAIENSEFKKLPFCVWGSHGIGKTEIISQVAADMNMSLVILHLSTQDITDLIGIPYQQNGVQSWSVPKWLNDANERFKNTGKANLFLLDEMNRGHQIVLKAMLPFLLDGTLHLHSIGPKDCVIAACNPSTDDYEVNDMTDKALLDRMGHVLFQPTRDEYIKYCISKNMDASTISVLKSNSKFTDIPKTEMSFNIEPSRRAIFNVMSVIGKKDRTWIKNSASHVIECYLGTEFRDSWINEYARNDTDIDLETLQNFSKNKKLILERIVKNIDGLNSCSVDTVERLTSNIKAFIQEKDDLLSENDMQWIIEFYSLPLIPAEFPTSVFIGNYNILKLSIRNTQANKIIGEFINKRKLFSQAVESW